MFAASQEQRHCESRVEAAVNERRNATAVDRQLELERKLQKVKVLSAGGMSRIVRIHTRRRQDRRQAWDDRA
jgi:hypothetical protein